MPTTHEDCGVREPGPQQLTQVPRASSPWKSSSWLGKAPVAPSPHSWPLSTTSCSRRPQSSVFSQERMSGGHRRMTLGYKCCGLFSSFRADAGTPLPWGSVSLEAPIPTRSRGIGTGKEGTLPGPSAPVSSAVHPGRHTQAARKIAWQHASCVKQENRLRWRWVQNPQKQHCQVLSSVSQVSSDGTDLTVCR